MSRREKSSIGPIESNQIFHIKVYTVFSIGELSKVIKHMVHSRLKVRRYIHQRRNVRVSCSKDFTLACLLKCLQN